MASFANLEGVAGGSLEGPFVESITAAMEALRFNRICSYAGEYGAITVWIDDEKRYQCRFSRWLIIENSETFITKKAVKIWLKDWLQHCDCCN